ncbi:transglutaminase-like domain-containing protein [Mucilaginibacter myungsuensis]|uniref:Transglutaminase family protein n=1 Tax=Mucilaginibacter myungsuensis TaxID=649104 RepID=A0A929KZN5_9SPHI|nr:transglutaminase family protein [Mucilaginibacter myungsuensis]MBE9664661.1 transglutaminase family protein [Mucilaginibacter myungsuensis]MDN3601133.1 transglutaminase family protein [Mucilaginibacter myungsuensis]
MKLNVTAQLNYVVKSASTIILNIHALKTADQQVLQETFTTTPEVKMEELQNVGGENRFMRLDITQPCELTVNYDAIVNNAYKIIDHRDTKGIAMADLEPAVFPFLNQSRYCQSDKLYRIAGHMFGDISSPFEQVKALTNWINTNVLYLSGSSNAQTSAYETVTEQAGVCRDFAHLGIALCRALTIPARYFTGYAYKLNPADFHACFEAYIGGEWVLFDATGLAPLNGMVKIATGRDAADAPVSNLFGDVYGTGIKVNCELIEGDFKSYFYPKNRFEGITYL